MLLTLGNSLQTWADVESIERELALYNELSEHVKHIYIFTYGTEEDLKFNRYLARGITVVPKTYAVNNSAYLLMIPIVHRKILKKVDFLKTNQMLGSWSAVLAKILLRKKLLVRTGYVLTRDCVSRHEERCWKAKMIERVSYRAADAIMTSSFGGATNL